MNYLLDTCVISEFARSQPNEQVTHWLSSQTELTLYLSTITLGEIQRGISKLSVSRKRKALQLWLDNDLIDRFHNRVLPVDTATSITWGKIQAKAEKKGEKMPAIDSLIAAIALTHKMTVVTRNTKDMANSGARLFNPWE